MDAPPPLDQLKVKHKYYFDGHAEAVHRSITESVTIPKNIKLFLQSLYSYHRDLGRNLVIWFTSYRAGNFEVVVEAYHATNGNVLVWQHKEKGFLPNDRK